MLPILSWRKCYCIMLEGHTRLRYCDIGLRSSYFWDKSRAAHGATVVMQGEIIATNLAECNNTEKKNVSLNFYPLVFGLWLLAFFQFRWVLIYLIELTHIFLNLVLAY